MYHLRVAALTALSALACTGVSETPFEVRPPEISLVPADITAADLGFASAVDINDLGQVLGSDGSTVVLWDPSTGITTVPATSGVALNNLGQVLAPDGVWDPVTGFTPITGGELSVGPQDLNDLGQVVGFTVEPYSNLTQEFLWEASTGLSTLPGVDGVDDVAFGINNKVGTNNLGQVVGRFRNPANGEIHAFLWDPSSGMTDLGTLPGGAYSEAVAVNDLGQVVGRSRTETGGPCPSCGFDFRPFLWEAGPGMVDLGSLGGTSAATDINNLGQVVGRSVNMDGTTRAFLWYAAGGMTDLGGLSGTGSSRAHAINDLGQVVGVSTNASGETRATLWTTLRQATPAEETEILTAAIEDLEDGGGIPAGQARALLATVRAAGRQVASGNAAAAQNILEAFIHQVETFMEAGHLSAADAQALIEAARNAIAQLQA